MRSVSDRHIDPTFSGRHPKLFLISDLYRVDTEIAEVHDDIARSFLTPLYPCYLTVGGVLLGQSLGRIVLSIELLFSLNCNIFSVRAQRL